MEQRLQKILASAGYGSRRACEELILAGRVTVNGQPVHLGSKADVQKDRIKLDGKLIKPLKPFNISHSINPGKFCLPSLRPTLAKLLLTWCQLMPNCIPLVAWMWIVKV